MLIILLPQPLLSSDTQFSDDCCVNQVQLTNARAFNAVPVDADLTEVYGPTGMDPYFTMNIVYPLVWSGSNLTFRHQMLRMIAQNLADVGVEVYLHFLEDEADFFARISSGKLFDDGGYAATLLGWVFSPEEYENASAVAQIMHSLYHSSNMPGGGTEWNILMWNNTGSDALLDAAVASTNEAEIESLLYEWQALFHEEQPSAIIVCYEMRALSLKGFYNLHFNMLHPVFGTGIDTPLGQSDPSRAAEAAKYVRQAISHTIDREWFALNLPTEWQSAEPGITPIRPDWPSFNPSLEPYSLNLTEARRLLSLAGYEMRLGTDLNKDGTVNILDIALVAKAYGTIPGDDNWNEIADLDNNERIDILDIATVAKDYGKTV